MIIETEIEIAAPPMKVWRALCDFGSYGKWNPYREVLGVAAIGQKVTILIGPDPGRRHKLRATISALESGRVLAFDSGRTPFVKATESFTVQPGRRGTLLRHRAEMTGVGVLLFGRRWFEPRLLSVYQKVDKALDKYVTSGAQLKMSARNRRRTGR